MTMSDPLGDMLTRIRNGQNARLKTVRCPYSKLRENVCKVLQDEGFIRGIKIIDLGNNKKDMEIELKYDEGIGAIHEIKRDSKPGRRTYAGAQNMPRVHNGLGMCIVSTPRGVMADHQAREQNVGGEVLCRVF